MVPVAIHRWRRRQKALPSRQSLRQLWPPPVVASAVVARATVARATVARAV